MGNEKACRFCGRPKSKQHRCWETGRDNIREIPERRNLVSEDIPKGSKKVLRHKSANTINNRNRRGATGERKLFVQIYVAVGGLSLQSGKPLLPPEHDLFHWQFSHILPKGLYKRFRLYGKNIIPMLREEHDFVGTHEGEARKDPNYNWYFLLKEILEQEYYGSMDNRRSGKTGIRC
jgi:hypothetical protein